MYWKDYLLILDKLPVETSYVVVGILVKGISLSSENPYVVPVLVFKSTVPKIMSQFLRFNLFWSHRYLCHIYTYIIL